MDCEANCPGEPSNSLADFLSTREAMRREEVVERCVAAVFQGFNRCLFGEVVNVPVQFATLQKPSLAQHRLYAQIQRKVEDLQFALRSDCVQEPEIIFDVLNDIEDQHQIEERAFVLTDIPEFELESFVRSAPAHLQRLWRDVITAENAFVVQSLLKQP